MKAARSMQEVMAMINVGTFFNGTSWEIVKLNGKPIRNKQTGEVYTSPANLTEEQAIAHFEQFLVSVGVLSK